MRSPTSTSPSLDPALLELADDPYAVLPARPGQARLDEPCFFLRHSSTPFPLGGRGRTASCWCVGPSATPPDLLERLVAQGARPMKGLEVGSGMVLADPPPAGPEDVATRRLETLAEAEAAVDISLEAFGWPEDPAEREQFGAFVDGRLVAFGLSTYSPHGVHLDGGATLAEARRRGATRLPRRSRSCAGSGSRRSAGSAGSRIRRD